MAANTLIFDTDGGVDDAQALILLLAHGRAPDIITTSFGNVGLDAATDNILATLATFGAAIPVHAGAARPLVQPLVDAIEIHGADGLGGAPRPATAARAASSEAVGVLRQLFREAAARGETADILTLGPLTNLALALRTEPGIAAGIGRVTVMGGTCFGRGNVTPAAEFNIFCDPEAAAIVFTEPLDTVLVPWEPCVASAVAGAELDAMLGAAAPSAGTQFSAALAAHLRRGARERGGADRLILPDPLAAAVLLDPRVVTGAVKASVAVALAPGPGFGMTVVDPSGRFGTPKLTVVEAVDAARLAELYRVSLAYAGARAGG